MGRQVRRCGRAVWSSGVLPDEIGIEAYIKQENALQIRVMSVSISQMTLVRRALFYCSLCDGCPWPVHAIHWKNFGVTR